MRIAFPAILIEPIVQSLQADPQKLGSLTLAAVAMLESCDDDVPLDVLQWRAHRELEKGAAANRGFPGIGSPVHARVEHDV